MSTLAIYALVETTKRILVEILVRGSPNRRHLPIRLAQPAWDPYSMRVSLAASLALSEPTAEQAFVGPLLELTSSMQPASRPESTSLSCEPTLTATTRFQRLTNTQNSASPEPTLRTARPARRLAITLALCGEIAVQAQLSFIRANQRGQEAAWENSGWKNRTHAAFSCL